MDFDFKFEETFDEYIYIFLNLEGKLCLKNRLMVWTVKKKKCKKKKLKVKEKKVKSKRIKCIKKSKIKSKIIKCIKNLEK